MGCSPGAPTLDRPHHENIRHEGANIRNEGLNPALSIADIKCCNCRSNSNINGFWVVVFFKDCKFSIGMSDNSAPGNRQGGTLLWGEGHSHTGGFGI